MAELKTQDLAHASGEMTLRPKPRFTKSQQLIEDHRATLAFEVDVVLDGYWRPSESNEKRAAILADWCDELEDWPLDEVRMALKKHRCKEPNKRPNSGHIIEILQNERKVMCEPQLARMSQIIDDIESQTGVRSFLMYGRRNTPNILKARAKAIASCIRVGICLSLIAERFGNRDEAEVAEIGAQYTQNTKNKGVSANRVGPLCGPN